MRFISVLVLSFLATTSIAQTSDNPKSNLAQNGLKKTLAQLATDPAANGFEIGMLQTLRAVEKTLQTRFEYELGESIISLPILRLNIQRTPNRSPKKPTPSTLSEIIDVFINDVNQARTTLGNAESTGIIPFEMTLQDIWFDVNGNGKREETEGAFWMVGETILGPRGFAEFQKTDPSKMQPLIIRFDQADHAWLTAYTNMLSGVGNAFMAFDPEPVLRDLAENRAALADAPTIPNIYDWDAIKADIARLKLEQEAMKKQKVEIQALIDAIEDDRNILRKKRHQTDDEVEKSGIQAAIDGTQPELDLLYKKRAGYWQAAGLISNEIAAAEAKLPTLFNSRNNFFRSQQAGIDLAYVVITALAQEPDTARIQAAYDDLRAMIKHNRIFWERLGAETDNDREWIPNESQISAMPFDIPPGLARGWQAILKDVEDALDGNLLITHPLLPDGYGISLRAYAEDPSSLDLIGWIHGIKAYRYAAKGPRLTTQSWRAFQRLTSGNANGFALFLN